MGKALIIAEKPSVASDIAKALGGFTKDKSGEFFESDRYVVSSAVGHLLEICVPENEEVKKGKWSFAKLPVIPSRFDLRPIEKNESRLKVLVRLLKRKDVDALVNACDAGREGELIFRYIVQYAGSDKPQQRLWLQSMTPAAIREGFEKLRTDLSMRPLADAAVCRSESDWLIGINGTRAMTAFNSKTGGFYLTTVGRVQTPTLAILVEREAKIKKFSARHYWEVHGTFLAQAGEYVGRWFDEGYKKEETEANRAKRLSKRFQFISTDPEMPMVAAPDEAVDLSDAPFPHDLEARLGAKYGTFWEEHRSSLRLWHAEIAQAIHAKCLGKPGIVTEESKPTSQLSPLLYDLTSLQRDANGRFGFSAKNTLAVAQALYEKHKVLTYPRTDSRALPEDYIGTVKKTLDMFRDTTYSGFAETVLKNDWVRPNKRIFNNAKVSDHFAIIPTLVAPKGLSEPEQKLYDLVTKRFLAVFYPAAEFLVTTRITRVETEPFKSEGKVMVNAGWMAVYGKEVQSDDQAPSLVPIQQNEKVSTTKIDVILSQTKPPPRFTEATLLSAMEGAGKLIDDEELRAAMSEKGLGTPATRAAIIEGLIYEKYIFRQERALVPSSKAFSLMELLRGLDIPELCSPELTGNWEFKLKQMEKGLLARPEFMRQIAEMTQRIVDKTKRYEFDEIPGEFGELTSPCPKCGGKIKETYKRYRCGQCDFSFSKIMGGRQFEQAEAEDLMTKRLVGPLQGFRSQKGFPFAAIIKLTPEFKAEFDFGQSDKQADGSPAAEVDFTGKEPLGKCPKCGSSVFENGMNYICEKAAGGDKKCDFRSGAVILQQPIDKAQMTKLLTTGKTDLLTKFISKRTNRAFKAFLVVKDGKTSFEFAPREGKGKGDAKSKEPAPKIDFSGQEPLGECVKCGGSVYEGSDAYICEKGQADAKPCKFKISKEILGQPVDPAQAKKLLAEKKSDLLQKFVSKAGRNFPAWLVMDDKGKVTFEFPEREETSSS